ncbi:hypothetical protein [Methylogaea oryzae]|uniref:Uncharacterized protein n=1 Tax=Methylogaea oryzae TaxID=1295382 RepID=A0A8D4VM33_9GAMM|nr:hypothetical protein [Methylogaea oryzae]BBL70340.1 hypothetical protein MoryE10_09460 [Methylogaea oryzae]
MANLRSGIILFEWAPPFRWRPKREHYGPMRRFIWGWWSVAWFEGCGINQLLAAYRADERQRCADEVQALAELRNPASWEAQALREAAEELARGR